MGSLTRYCAAHSPSPRAPGTAHKQDNVASTIMSRIVRHVGIAGACSRAAESVIFPLPRPGLPLPRGAPEPRGLEEDASLLLEEIRRALQSEEAKPQEMRDEALLKKIRGHLEVSAPLLLPSTAPPPTRRHRWPTSWRGTPSVCSWSRWSSPLSR